MSKLLQQKKKKGSPREIFLTSFVGAFLFHEFGIDNNSLVGCVVGEPDPGKTSTEISKGLKEAEALKEPENVKKEEALKDPEGLKEAFENLNLKEVGLHQEVLERMRSFFPELDRNKPNLTQEESLDEITEKYNRITASFDEVKRVRKAIDTKNPWVGAPNLEQSELSEALQKSIIAGALSGASTIYDDTWEKFETSELEQARPFASLSETAAPDESVASPTLPANNQESGGGVKENSSDGYETPKETW